MINVFTSHPTPYKVEQKIFLRLLQEDLRTLRLNGINLGKNDWNFQAPLKPIKQLMMKCNAAIIVGLERQHCLMGYEKQFSKEEKEFTHKYQSSAWIQLEAGMAYQLGIPILILKESKLSPEGILNAGISEYSIFEFDLEKCQRRLPSEMKKVIRSWSKFIEQNQIPMTQK